MNEKHTHLDDLFADARRQAVPEITKEQIAAIAEHADSLQSQSLFSRKGITIMTSIFTVTAATLIGYLALSPSATLPVAQHASGTSSASVAHVAQTSTTEPTHKMITVTAVAPENAVPATPAKPAIPPVPQKRLIPPIVPFAPEQIKAVDPIVVSESNYPKLGLHNGFTGLTFFMGDTRKSCSKYTIPEQGWGVIIDRKSSPQESDVVLNPVLVTDSRGNRRLINFSDSEGSYMMSRSSDANHQSFEQRIISNDGGTNVTIHGSRSTTDDDSLSMSDLRTLGVFGTPGMLDSVNAAIRSEIARISRGTRGLRKDSSIMPMMHMRILVQDSEHVKQLNTIDTNLVIRLLRGFKSCDTIADGINGQRRVKFVIRHETNLSTDSIGTAVPQLLNALTIDNVGRSVEERLSARLNSLVPVLVRPATTVTHNHEEDRDYDNGVVMWFAPSPELNQALSATTDDYDMGGANISRLSVRAIADGSGAMQHATIFPNPAQTTASVRFTLSEPRMVAFSVHNILGQKMLDGGEVAFGAGEQTRSINIESLSDGMYLLAITTDHGEQVIQRIVVRK